MSNRTASSSPSKRLKHATFPSPAGYSDLEDLDADIHGSHVRSILVSPTSSFPPTTAQNMSASTTNTTMATAQPEEQQQQQQQQQLQVKRLSPSARLPTRGSAFAAGYDMYASEDGVVPARGMGMVSTGVAIAVPAGTYGRVAPRSGLAVKHSITTGAGVIDYDYRGEVKVVLFNLGDVDFRVAAGDRVAQLVLERIVTPEVIEVAELVGTERGASGFGSTGGFGGGGVQQVLVLQNGSAKRKGEDEAMDLSV